MGLESSPESAGSHGAWLAGKASALVSSGHPPGSGGSDRKEKPRAGERGSPEGGLGSEGGGKVDSLRALVGTHACGGGTTPRPGCGDVARGAGARPSRALYALAWTPGLTWNRVGPREAPENLRERPSGSGRQQTTGTSVDAGDPPGPPQRCRGRT